MELKKYFCDEPSMITIFILILSIADWFGYFKPAAIGFAVSWAVVVFNLLLDIKYKYRD